MRRSLTFVALLAALAFAPTGAFAQGDSSIAGVVTDNTGGILPGVTVEAASPVLIAGSRIAISDGTGQYNIVDLRPGTYNITFTLPGFSTVLVEAQELPAGFALNLDAELSVGALEETVTVSGEAPVIDVQSVTQAEVLTREVLDAIPTGRNMQSTAQLIPGVKLNRPEVGLTTAAQQTYMSVHGMGVQQTTTLIDGMHVASSGYDGANQNYINLLANQEMVYDTSGIGAETSTGGVRISMIPREGGNVHSGQNYFAFSQGRLQASNLTDRYQQRGGQSVESISGTYDINVAHGGPIIQDRFWFFGSARRYHLDVPVTNSFYQNKEGLTNRYFTLGMNPTTGQPDRPAGLDGNDGREYFPGINDDRMTSGLLRLTTQFTQSNKFSAYLDRIIKQRFHDYDSRVDVGTATRHHGSPIYYVSGAKWTSTLSNRLLLEVGYSATIENWSNVDQESVPPRGPGGNLAGDWSHSQLFGDIAGWGNPGVMDGNRGWPTCQVPPCFPSAMATMQGAGAYAPGTWDGTNHMHQVGGLYEGLTNNTQVVNPNGSLSPGIIHPFYANTLRRSSATNFADRYHWGDRTAYVERFNTNSAISYVTGSHNLKLGLMTSFGPFQHNEDVNGAIRQRYTGGGLPRQVGRTNHFSTYNLGYVDTSLYVQDTWTLDRLTLNVGARWERIQGYVDETLRPYDTRWTQRIPGGIGSKDNLPNWAGIAPRLGFAYDLFGDARTALKFSWGKYHASTTHSVADRFHTGKVQWTSSNWWDCAYNYGDNSCASWDWLATNFGPEVAMLAYGPDSGSGDSYAVGIPGTTNTGGTNGDDYVQDWEAGPTSNAQDFGLPGGTPNIVEGNFDRPWAGLTNFAIDHELRPGLSVSFNWYRRDSHGGLRQYNASRGPDDYVYFEVPNPCGASAASRAAPNGFPCFTAGSGDTYDTLPVYALKDARRSESSDNRLENILSGTAANLGPYGGEYGETYTGFEGGFNVRAAGGATIFGAYTIERNVIKRCDEVSNPNSWAFCDASYWGVPWLHEFKMSGTVPLPGGFQFSGTLQSYTPRELLAIGSYAGSTSGGLNGGGTLWGSLARLGNVGYRVETATFPTMGVDVEQLVGANGGAIPFTADGRLDMAAAAAVGVTANTPVDKVGAVFLPLMPGGSTYQDRLNQIDLSIRKIMDLPGGKRLNIQADVYNVFNLTPIISTTNEYGGSLGNVLRSIQGRFVQIATHLYW